MTELLHLTYEGNFKLECEAKVVMCILCDKRDQKDQKAGNDKNEIQVQLDVTSMHPQGGGQPTDVGKLMMENGDILDVDFVSIDRASNIVTHTCSISSADAGVEREASVILPVGSQVKVSVDADRRRLLSECHTAGHVVDSAMAKVGLSLPPTKGYHFLDGPYVEYKGKIPPEEREELVKSLQGAFTSLVDENIETKIDMFQKDEAEAICNRLQQNFDMSMYEDGSDVRIVTVADWSCPCGGTHVKSTGELKARGWNVTGIKSKKGVVRVKYSPSTL